jgi:hypothetical protein
MKKEMPLLAMGAFPTGSPAVIVECAVLEIDRNLAAGAESRIEIAGRVVSNKRNDLRKV